MFFLFLVMKSPNWKKITFERILFFSFLPIILIIFIFAILLVLPDHSFHNFHASQKRRRVSSRLDSFFRNMLILITFIILLSFFFKILDITIPNFPLSDLSSNVFSCWWDRCCSSLSYLRVNCLDFSTIVIEFISHRLFNSLYILT